MEACRLVQLALYVVHSVAKRFVPGLHKHFRMLAISDYLKSQGYAPSTAEHMRIPGIWKKLGTLYNLEALDERVSEARCPVRAGLPLLMCTTPLGRFCNHRYQRGR
jgi:hypothetical protein